MNIRAGTCSIIRGDRGGDQLMGGAARIVASVPVGRHRSALDACVRPLRLSDPNRIRGYVLTGRLGRGGEAVVYRGQSRRTGPVAVKVLRTGGATVGRPSRCEHEFDMAGHVDQRFVMPPIEAGTSGAGPYLVSTYRPEYRSLAGHGPLSARRLWQLAYASALAIAAIHAGGVIHCDIKPANLLAFGGDVRLIDFGIARHAADQPLTSDLVHCSRGWSAPEQLSAAPLTPAVDVFGWGCVMGYLAAGVTPFASATFDEWALRVRSAEADLSGLPDGLTSLVHLALRRDPTRRPSAAYLAAACRAAAAGGATGVRPAGAIGRSNGVVSDRVAA
jgi:serine/threonine protein kinase